VYGEKVESMREIKFQKKIKKERNNQNAPKRENKGTAVKGRTKSRRDSLSGGDIKMSLY
jgi:hypothetical protein